MQLKKDKYIRIPAARNDRRSFSISVGLRVGYDEEATTHDPAKATTLLEEWIQQKIAAGEEYLTGILTTGQLTYAGKDNKQARAQTEPTLIFSGEVSIYNNAETSDETIEVLLNEIACIFATAFGQIRVSITYKDQTWDLRTADKNVPGL